MAEVLTSILLAAIIGVLLGVVLALRYIVQIDMKMDKTLLHVESLDKKIAKEVHETLELEKKELGVLKHRK